AGILLDEPVVRLRGGGLRRVAGEAGTVGRVTGRVPVSGLAPRRADRRPAPRGSRAPTARRAPRAPRPPTRSPGSPRARAGGAPGRARRGSPRCGGRPARTARRGGRRARVGIGSPVRRT